MRARHAHYALITGGSRGVGRATARALAAQGTRLVLHAGRSLEAAADLAEELGDAVLGVLAADLAEVGAGTRLFREADALAGGRLDLLVNNAGVYLATPLACADSDWQATWLRQLQVNLIAAADLCRAAVLAFAARGGGSIVNVASRAGYRGDDADHSAYAASKGGLLALSKTLARAYGDRGVLVYALAPGWIATRMAPDDAAGRAAARNEIPIGRMATAEEIAAMIAFLASGACASATGACIDINGASYVR